MSLWLLITFMKDTLVEVIVKNRGTQPEYSSKPLKHSIVKRILVFKGRIWAYFYPL